MAMEYVNFTNIQKFHEEFMLTQRHLPGSIESSDYAHNISELWKDFGFPKVEIEAVKVRIPKKASIPSEILVKSAKGKQLFQLNPTSQVKIHQKKHNLFFNIIHHICRPSIVLVPLGRGL